MTRARRSTSDESRQDVDIGQTIVVIRRRTTPSTGTHLGALPANRSVFGALLADVDYLVSDDRKHVVPHGEPHEYEHEDHRLLAVTFGYLVSELMPAIDWDERDVP
jgi:hypothetical protein